MERTIVREVLPKFNGRLMSQRLSGREERVRWWLHTEAFGWWWTDNKIVLALQRRIKLILLSTNNFAFYISFEQGSQKRKRGGSTRSPSKPHQQTTNPPPPAFVRSPLIASPLMQQDEPQSIASRIRKLGSSNCHLTK